MCSVKYLISQTEEDKYCMISLYVESKKAELIETESRMMVTRGISGDVGQRLQTCS